MTARAVSFVVLFFITDKEWIEMQQLDFNLPEVDKEQTREAVERALEKYRMYALQESLDRLPTMTADYSLMPRSNTGTTSDSTAVVALANVSYEQERARFLKMVTEGVNRLSARERAIIVLGYLKDEPLYDYQIYSELNLSERQFYRLKASAFYKLAFILKVHVYK